MSRHIFISIVLMLASLTAAAAGKSTVTVSLDSVHLVMGQVTTLHVDIVTDADHPATMVPLPDVITPGVEKHSEGEDETTKISDGRIEIKKDIKLQSFDSGLYMLPPVKIVMPSGETIASNQVTIKVFPVNVDSLKNIHPYADVSTVERSWSDYLPDWAVDYGPWILLGLAVIALGIFVWYFLFGKGRPVKARKVEPPYNVAMRELQQLNSEHLCDSGREKEYYTRLTDILRVYLDRRFGINAMEMTSSQIVDAINANSETRASRELIGRVLQIADFVKFAKVRPLPQDNVASFDSALKFVEDTKPVPRPEGEEDTDKDASAASKEAKNAPADDAVKKIKK